MLTTPKTGSHVTLTHCELETTTGVPAQWPVESHTSPVVHALASEHVVPAATGVCTQPDGVHAAVVHALLGMHVAGVQPAPVSLAASDPPVAASVPASVESQTPSPFASPQGPTRSGGVDVSRDANSIRPAGPSSTFLIKKP